MRPFADVLRDLSRGQTYDDLTTSLAEVVAASLETGKTGSLTLKLTVKPNGDASVLITDDIKTTVPTMKRPDTLFMATSSGALLRDDPDRANRPAIVAGPTMPSLAKEA